MIATFYIQSLNPINGFSVFALIVFGLVILATRRFVPRNIRLPVIGLGPPILLLLYALLPSVRYRDAGHYIASYVLLAAAFGLALHNFHYPRLAHRINGIIFTYVIGTLICLHAAVRLEYSIPLVGPLPAAVVFLICWTPIVVRLNLQTLPQRRIDKGLCAACGYNLTANVSGICPECGKPCEPDTSAT